MAVTDSNADQQNGGQMWGAIAAAAGSALDFITGGREAKKNRDFQEAMSSSAHQREVKDLEAAGLNRILSATGGAGSSTPGGATAPGSNTVGALGKVIEMKLANANINNINRDTLLKESQERQANSATALNQQQGRINTYDEKLNQFKAKFIDGASNAAKNGRETLQKVAPITNLNGMR